MTSESLSEFERIKREALKFEGKTPDERVKIFIRLLEEKEALEAHLTPEERERRRQIADELDPLPKPWWRNIRKEALEEYQRMRERASDDLLNRESGS
jgi:hypothetical protein